MLGAVLYGPRDVRFEERESPKIVEPTDAVVRMGVDSLVSRSSGSRDSRPELRTARSGCRVEEAVTTEARRHGGRRLDEQLTGFEDSTTWTSSSMSTSGDKVRRRASACDVGKKTLGSRSLFDLSLVPRYCPLICTTFSLEAAKIRELEWVIRSNRASSVSPCLRGDL
jgi:hypothetical protein